MKRFHRSFLAVLLSFLLVSGQQAAFAHLLSHLHGAATAAVMTYQNDDRAIDHLADACATCIAFTGVSGSAPLPSSPIFAVADYCDDYVRPPLAWGYTRLINTCRARAPPAFL